jgi:hypothetical protein
MFFLENDPRRTFNSLNLQDFLSGTFRTFCTP